MYMETKLKNEIQSLSSLIEVLESGVIEGEAGDLDVLKDKRADLEKLSKLHMMLALESAGIPAEIVMTKKQKARFLWFVRKVIAFRTFFKIGR